jgi:hypothetical protein
MELLQLFVSDLLGLSGRGFKVMAYPLLCDFAFALHRPINAPKSKMDNNVSNDP